MESQGEHSEDTFSNYCLKTLNPLTDTAPLSLETPEKSENPLPLKRSHTVANRCNCKKSKCIKLYCECFANEQYCVDCNCKRCFNKQERTKFRKPAVRKLLQRDPEAFTKDKPCNCSKSRCRKRYCECFAIGRKCTEDCNCVRCLNTE